MTGPRPIRRLAGCSSGAAALEFALIGLLVISLLLGIFEFGRALFLRNQLAFAADIATRRILLDPPETASDLESLKAAIRDSVPHGSSELQIELDQPSPGSTVLMTLRQPVTLLIPGLYKSGITVGVDRRIPIPRSR